MKGKLKRELAAVMFTDIVGYTALMQKDETEAARVRSRHREVFESQHKIHNGEIIQYFGDGTLSIFKSAIEATNCAIEIQKLLQEGDSVQLRIGLHLGDIVFNDTEVYGDGVNLASRIESMSDPGTILLSAKLNDELKNHPTISTSSLGSFELKNIAQPVEVFAVTNEGVKVPQIQGLKGKQNIANKTIAVLPFTNMSSDSENEYFSDGITEEIINALSKIDGLKVISRTSSFFFKNHKASLEEIASKLGVAILLEGSAQIHNGKIRVRAKLIDVPEDAHFWSEIWDRKLENLFETQDEISLLIADKIREQHGHLNISNHLVESPTKSISSYQHLLKGRHHFYKWNPEDTNLAIEHFEKSVELDKNLVEGYIGIADSYSFMAVAGFAPREEAWQKCITALAIAKKLDPNHAGLNYMLGMQSFFTEADFAAAMQYGMRSIAAKPTYSEAHQFVSFLHTLQGDFKKAQEHILFAKSSDPLNLETKFFEANYYYRVSEYEKAKAILTELLEANDKNLPAIIISVNILIREGKLKAARQAIDNIPEQAMTPDERLGLLAVIDAIEGNRTAHLKTLEKHAQEPDAHHAHSYLFVTYANLGQFDEAFAILERLFESASSILLISFSGPLGEPIHSDSRYHEYHSRIYPKTVEKPKIRKQRQADPALTNEQVEKIQAYVESERPYLNPSLTLRSLAQQVDIHPNQLSWLLNESIGKNFNEFINIKRIDHFKQLVRNPDNSYISLIGLAYESGFNSKTVFNTAFKKVVGMTPKEFQKSRA